MEATMVIKYDEMTLKKGFKYCLETSLDTSL